MNRRITLLLLLLAAAMLISGCAVLTVDEMYTPPKRSAEYQDLQNAIDAAMPDLEYRAPLSGENQQTVQMADLDGDGEEEYLLFAGGSSEMPLKILIFTRTEEGCQLKETIESGGIAFELVEYVDIDGKPGAELVVGRQVSDKVLKSLSVYTFSGGSAQQLMTANYSKFVTCDLDENGFSEVMVISQDTAVTDRAAAALYSYSEDGEMVRSREVPLSGSADHIKRIMEGDLLGDVPAVYVASSVEERAIITDIFAMKNGRFTNVSLSSESGTSVQTLRNYYVYAVDFDNDGVLELPSLITMVSEEGGAATEHLIRWYAMDAAGREVDRMYSFHNFAGGWYLELNADWAHRVTVTQEDSTYRFSLWDEQFQKTKDLMTVYVLTGSERESAAVQDERFLLYRGDEVLYAAELEAAAADCGITKESMVYSFHLIHKDWKTGETE